MLGVNEALIVAGGNTSRSQSVSGVFVHNQTTPRGSWLRPPLKFTQTPPTLSDCSHHALPTHSTRLNYPLPTTPRSFPLISHLAAAAAVGFPKPTSQPALNSSPYPYPIPTVGPAMIQLKSSAPSRSGGSRTLNVEGVVFQTRLHVVEWRNHGYQWLMGKIRV